jgi:hypothetical protein
MQAVGPIAITGAVAVTTLLIATAPLHDALASDVSHDNQSRVVIAQTSMGAPDPLPQMAPTTPAPAPQTPSTSPRMDYIPPIYSPAQPAPNQPSTSTDLAWGAIGFTADGSYSTTWKMASQPEAEARVAKKCAEFGRGGCQVVSFSGQECVALATFIGSYRRRRWNLSFTAGGASYPEAQNAAMVRCNSDERSQGRCQPRTAACADGR